MVATGDLKSPVLGRAGSTPATRTNLIHRLEQGVLVYLVCVSHYSAPFVYRLGHRPFTSVRRGSIPPRSTKYLARWQSDYALDCKPGIGRFNSYPGLQFKGVAHYGGL